mgnify:CR=1 FL=1
MHRIREKYVLYPILHINPYNLDKRADYYLETTIRIQKTGGMDTKSWESIPPESYVIYINLPVPVLHRQSDLQYSQFQD